VRKSRDLHDDEYTLESYFRKTKTVKDKQERTPCVYKIPYECGRMYIGENDRPLATRLREHKYNLKEGHLTKSKLAMDARWYFTI
jgi:hypothetical protein